MVRQFLRTADPYSGPVDFASQCIGAGRPHHDRNGAGLADTAVRSCGERSRREKTPRQAQRRHGLRVLALLRALDGWLCTCCGGTISSCPPGTEVSKVTWVGTCHNPNDGRIMIAADDCCGATSCGRCLCNGNEGERPGYRMGVHNDVNWCMANSNNSYHCTVAAVVGTAESPRAR